MSKFSISYRGSVIAAAALLALGAANAAPSVSAPKVNAPSAKLMPASVLYDQNDNAGANGVTSQNFEASFDIYDTMAADDFTVPKGKTWTVTEVSLTGSYSTGGPAASLHVVFYKNKKNLPGAVVKDVAAAAITSDSGGSFVAKLPKVKLKAGKYWIGISANQDFGTAGQWYWTDNTVAHGLSTAWKNPGGGFGVGCANFTDLDTCIPNTFGPDRMFALGGKSK